MRYKDEIVTPRRILRFLKKIIYTHSSVLVFETPLEFSKRTSKIPNLNIKEAQMDDLSYLIEERGIIFENYARNAFVHGDICFIAEVDGKAVACLWGRPHDVYLGWVEYDIKLDDRTIGAADGYTHPKYRGQGLYAKLFVALAEYVSKHENYKRILGFIEPRNTLSMNVHKKLGFKKIVMKIEFTRITGIKRHKIESVGD